MCFRCSALDQTLRSAFLFQSIISGNLLLCIGDSQIIDIALRLIGSIRLASIYISDTLLPLLLFFFLYFLIALTRRNVVTIESSMLALFFPE